MGAGTVGNRSAEVISSLGYNVSLCKYDGDPDDIKTQELKQVYQRNDQQKNTPMRMYAARGSNLKKRIKRLDTAGFNCNSSIDDLDFSTIDLVIDATNGRENRNYLEIYKPNNIPFAINGGGLDRIVDSNYFAGVPGSIISEGGNNHISKNVKIVSCNTHCGTTALGILREVINKYQKEGGDDLGGVKFIDITYLRRHEDPHKGKSKPEFVNIQSKDYHLEELYSLIPQTDGKAHSTVSKWPTEYFHNVIMDIDFNQKLFPEIVEKYKLALQEYPRSIFVENELDHEKTIKATSWAGIPDGDLPFPVYMVKQIHDQKLKIYGLTPQRGIVAPSTADYVLMRMEGLNWKEAFDKVNENAIYRGKSFEHIANSVQDNLRFFEKRKKEFSD